MKKLLLLACLIIVSIGTYATVLFTSSCGKKTYTVDPAYFASSKEAEEYYMELDEALCGPNSTTSSVVDK